MAEHIRLNRESAPEPPTPAWFMMENGEIYDRDIRPHVEGKIVNWQRLDAQLRDNWRPCRREKVMGPEGSLERLVAWGEADYWHYFHDAAQASCVASVTETACDPEGASRE